jgi:hypothetical protein
MAIEIIPDALWERESADHERFNAGLMTQAEVKTCMAYWLATAKTCKACADERAANEFSGFAEYMADMVQEGKDHALCDYRH